MPVSVTFGRLLNSVQVAPPTAVLSTDGSCKYPVGPTIQQVVAVGQSMASAHHGALAQSAGVLSVQVFLRRWSPQPRGRQHTSLVAQASASTWNVADSVA
jgi:hypothetical protein